MNIFSWLAENLDLPILDRIADHLQCALLDTLMPLVTLLGDAGIFWIAIAVVLLFFPRTRKLGLSMGMALLLGLVVCNIIIKPMLARPRPFDYQLEHFGRTIHLLVAAPHDFSFPSGHTIASFEAAAAIAIHNKKWGIPALVLACLIAFSRLYLYVHYPTDVLASVVLGIGFAFLGSWLVKKGYEIAKK